MTLQLRVGGVYRARNGDVVKIVARSLSQEGALPFKGDNEDCYKPDGGWSNGILKTSPFDLIEEISAPSPASELDEAIAKFEREWDAAKQAMDKAQLAADDVAQAIRTAMQGDRNDPAN